VTSDWVKDERGVALRNELDMHYFDHLVRIASYPFDSTGTMRDSFLDGSFFLKL
jgi:hypothetical protein